MMRFDLRRAIVSAVVVASAARPVAADDELDVDVPRTVLVAGSATTLWALSEVFKGELAPSACRWCASNGFDGSARDAIVWEDRAAAARASDVIAFAVAPAAAIGLGAFAARAEGRLENAPVDALVVLEATALAMDVNQVAKLTIGRERPFVHALEPADKGLTRDPADNNLSFYSGHMALTTALATSAGTVATLRGYRWAPLVWGVGLPLAAATGYLRIAADKHYASDVIVGGVLGAAVGVGAPVLLHRKRKRAADRSVSIARTGGCTVVALTGRF